MTAESVLTLKGLRALEYSLFEAAQKATDVLKPDSLGVFVRKPLVDEDCPEASDVDLISIWETAEEWPERMTVDCVGGRKFVDVLWIPISNIFDTVEAAGYKTLPHLLLEYEAIWVKSETVKSIIDNIKLNTFDVDVWARRIRHQIGFGEAAFQEAQKNLDFPPGALFFLQTAHAYYAAALADCLKWSTMSLQTRPVTKLRRMGAEIGVDLERVLVADLHLDVDPTGSLLCLRRVYDHVLARCAGCQLYGTSMRTRGHFAYSLSPVELEFRMSVAKALIEHGDYANANFYLRFWAYSLARCPIVLEEARQGRKPSFYVPFEPFKGSVEASCPEILDDLETILGEKLTVAEAEDAIKGTARFESLVVEAIQSRGKILV